MKRRLMIGLTVLAALATTTAAQNGSIPKEDTPLLLIRAIPMAGVEGRFDHMAFDTKHGKLFATVFGNDTVEVIDMSKARRMYSITGLNKPQGAVYIPETNRVMVTNGGGDGAVKIFDGTTYKLVDTVPFPDGDSDQIRYDPATHIVYVGYGDAEKGAIGMIDARTDKRIDGDFIVGAHPESFQLEASGSKIFVNLESINQVAVIDRNTHKVTKWPLKEAGTNFPMALDEPHHRLIIGARRPPRLLVLDSESGKVVANVPSANDTDDLWFDPDRKRVYVPGGEGVIFVFQQLDADHYKEIARIPTTLEARTSAYSVETIGKHNDLYLAVPARGNQPAEMWVYETVDESE